MNEPCPRCGGTTYTERDCGPDSYEDDIFYISYVCDGCGLWYDGWDKEWYAGVKYWQDTADLDPWRFTTPAVSA